MKHLFALVVVGSLSSLSFGVGSTLPPLRIDKPARVVWRTSGESETVRTIVFSPDGSWLAIGAGDNNDPHLLGKSNSTIRMWDVRRRKFNWKRQHCHVDLGGLAFSPDGWQLASVGGDDTVKLWDVRSGRPRRRLRFPNTSIGHIAFSPDGKRLAFDIKSCGGKSCQAGPADIILWSLRTGRYSRIRRPFARYVGALAFSPDGKLLAGSGDSATVKVWRVSNRRLKFALDNGITRNLEFSSDGKRLACTSQRERKTGELQPRIGQLKLWNVNTGRLDRTLEGFLGSADAITFTRNGRSIAGGGWDHGKNHIKMWDCHTGALTHVFQHDCPTIALAIAPFGHTLASAGHAIEARDGFLIRNECHVKLWHIE